MWLETFDMCEGMREERRVRTIKFSSDLSLGCKGWLKAHGNGIKTLKKFANFFYRNVD